MEDKPKRYLWYVNWVKSHTDGKEFGTEVIQTEEFKISNETSYRTKRYG